MAGEDHQIKGFDGLRRAKKWLDASTRVKQIWTNENRGLKELLAFDWPHGKDFSFDMGGQLRGGDLEGKTFLAEVKSYTHEMDLAVHFREFLTQCYVALREKPDRSDIFMWISWSPFQAQKWHEHATALAVQKSVLKHCSQIFGTLDEAEAQKQIDPALISGVSQRVWMITLCDQQEDLVIAHEHYVHVVSLMLANDRRVAN
ncbi:hypothetical protein AB0L06_12325 [Spirillospora sp. NPDC052269]